MSVNTYPPRLLTSREVASFLRISRARVAQLVREGQLPAVRIGHRGDYRFRPEDIELLFAPSRGKWEL